MKTVIPLVLLIGFILGCSKEKGEADRSDSILDLLKSKQVTLNSSFETEIDTIVENNRVLPVSSDIKLAILSNEDSKKLQMLVSMIDKETIISFDEKIKSWINLWTAKPSFHSDPAGILQTGSQEYRAYVDFCIDKGKTVLPLLFELLSKTTKDNNSTGFSLMWYPLMKDILPNLPSYRKYLDQSIENYKSQGTNSGIDGNSVIVLGFAHHVLEGEF